MRTALVSVTLLLTVLAALVAGILSGYAAVSGVLLAFLRRPQKPPTQAPALVSSAEAGGR